GGVGAELDLHPSLRCLDALRLLDGFAGAQLVRGRHRMMPRRPSALILFLLAFALAFLGRAHVGTLQDSALDVAIPLPIALAIRRPRALPSPGRAHVGPLQASALDAALRLPTAAPAGPRAGGPHVGGPLSVPGPVVGGPLASPGGAVSWTPAKTSPPPLYCLN